MNTISTALISIEGLHIENATFYNEPLFKSYSTPTKIILKDGFYNNIQIDAGSSFYLFNEITDFEINNHTLIDSSSLDSNDITSQFLKIILFSIENTQNSVLKDIKILNFSISLIKIDSVSGNPIAKKVLKVENIKYQDISINNQRALISTNGIVSEFNFTIEFSNIEFSAIQYVTSGNLMYFGHQFPNTVTITNSTVYNITSGRIEVKTYNTNNVNLRTKVQFFNTTFSNIYSPLRSFISTSKGGYLGIQNCTFTYLSSTNFAFGILNSESYSEVVISESVLKNNSAVTSSLFLIESDSVVKCTQCEISNNFAITNGIFTTESSGRIEFYNSQIFDNYAFENPIGLIFVANKDSIIDSTEIYRNEIVPPLSLIAEMNNCAKL